MNIIAVDDERRALRSLTDAIAEAAPEAQVEPFLTAAEALEYARRNRVDVAFLDIRMAEMSGLILAKELKDICGSTNIVFVTGYSEYANEAFNLRASGYVMKPIDAERAAYELEDLRHPVRKSQERVRVQCFGNFEVFVDGSPLLFSRSGAKEILAYLVDRRGASVSKKEIAAIIWEDAQYTRSKQIQLQTLFSELRHGLSEAGIEGMLIKEHGLYAVDTAAFWCDYYEFLKGSTDAVNQYHGEYMTNYSWAEFTIGLP